MSAPDSAPAAPAPRASGGQDPGGPVAARGEEVGAEDEALAAEALAAAGDWTSGPPPGRAAAFWPSFKRMLGLLAPYKGSLAVAGLASVASVVMAVLSPKVLGAATNLVFEGAIR